MNNPSHNFYLIQMQFEKMQELLTAKNNNKAEVLALISKSINDIKIFQQEYWSHERMKEHEQTGYFENIKITYTTKYFGDNEVVSVYEREFKDYCIDLKTIQGMVRNERALHNKNECYLTAEIVLTDLDCEDEE
jgi:CRISPR/Cas system CMR subunit Cmr6 (Cas7 group RAMP superfamily)